MIEWKNEKVKLGNLLAWDENPRNSTVKQATRILESFEKYGQVHPIAIGPSNEVYDGHQRLSALLTIHGADYEVDARRSSRALTNDERKNLTVFLHASATGGWDWDLLSNWDIDLMEKWGMDTSYLASLNTDATNVREMLSANDQSPDDLYKGMPEYIQEDKDGIHKVVVHFETKEDVEEFARLVNQPVKLTTKFIWYPAQADENLLAYKAEDES